MRSLSFLLGVVVLLIIGTVLFRTILNKEVSVNVVRLIQQEPSPPLSPVKNTIDLPGLSKSNYTFKKKLATEDVRELGGKLSRPIRLLLASLEANGVTPQNYLEHKSSVINPFVRIDGDARIQLYIHTSSLDEKRLSVLEELGAEIELSNIELSIVQVWMEFDLIPEIAALPFVTRIEPPSYGDIHQGSKTTEGDSILKANQLRDLGIDGRGIKIGVISDGANDKFSAQGSGDLPPNITVYGSCAKRLRNGFQCDSGRTCNEGTAMMEIIHDIAPEAELAMGAVNTSLEFVQRVDDLVHDFGADVIVDDLGFFGEPYFADGPLAKAVAAVANDAIFISSAGNSADSHYEAEYRSGSLFVNGVTYDVHDFGRANGGGSDLSLDVSIDPGRYLVGFLQWNEQYGSSSSDYDLTLTNNGVTDLLCPDCISDEIQSGNENPIEAICYYNNSNQRVSGKLFVDRVSGSNRRIEMFVLGSGVETEYNVGEGSVFGHSGVPSVLAVGAINAEDSGTDNLAYYSSWGPARVDFPRFESRHKPDLVAIDGVSVTGTGGFPSQFFGTSAAAPHVAGIAALLKQAAPESTPSTLRSALKSSAVDLGTRGDDFLYGAGRVDSIAAVGILQPNFVSDSDSDGIVDAADLFPSDSKESIDSDGDGVGDNADSDDDNDGIADVKDLFPNDSTEHSDQDGDGIGDNSDIDVESELNGNAEQADRITFGMVGQLSSVSDEDWYQIDVDTPGGLVLTFEPEETSSLDYWEVTLEDQIGIVYAAIDTGEAGFFIAGIETSGSYFIVVRDGSAYSHSTASYSIQIESIVDGLDTLETEFNDSSNSSDQLNSQIYGQLYTVDDEDWFYLVISQPTTISVEFEPGESSRLDYWEIALENRKGSVLAALDTGSDGGFSVGIDTIGTYYLVVRDGSAYSHNTATYSLTVSCSSNRVDDSDCDGVENQNDAFPFDLNESEDTDGDGLGNYSDDDDDNDGITDAVELRVGLDPLNPNDVTGSSREILWRHKEAGFNVLWSMESQHRVGLTNLNTVTDPNWVVEGMADFTGDGMDEIFFRHQTTGSNRLWSIEDGFRTSSNVVRGVPLDWFVLAMADFDSDSDADLIWRNRNTGDNSYWEMDGNTRLSSVPIRSVRLDWNMVGTGDFDNDGRNDLLWRSNTGRNVVWLMHGETMSARGELATVMLTWEVVGVGDFDADGMDDILWHESSTGRNSIWLLDGTSRKSRASIPATGVGWHPFGVFDMNGDEMADILWRNNTNGQNRLWLMNGTSRMSSLPIRSVPNKNWQPVAIGNVSN